MGHDELCERVVEIIADIYEADNEGINMQTSMQEILNWSSLGQMTLIAELENKFGVEFSFDEIQSMRTVGRIVDVLSSKIGGRNMK